VVLTLWLSLLGWPAAAYGQLMSFEDQRGNAMGANVTRFWQSAEGYMARYPTDPQDPNYRGYGSLITLGDPAIFAQIPRPTGTGQDEEYEVFRFNGNYRVRAYWAGIRAFRAPVQDNPRFANGDWRVTESAQGAVNLYRDFMIGQTQFGANRNTCWHEAQHALFYFQGGTRLINDDEDAYLEQYSENALLLLDAYLPGFEQALREAEQRVRQAGAAAAGQQQNIWGAAHAIWCAFAAGWRDPNKARGGGGGVLELTQAQKNEYRQMTGVWIPTLEEFAAFYRRGGYRGIRPPAWVLDELATLPSYRTYIWQQPVRVAFEKDGPHHRFQFDIRSLVGVGLYKRPNRGTLRINIRPTWRIRRAIITAGGNRLVDGAPTAWTANLATWGVKGQFVELDIYGYDPRSFEQPVTLNVDVEYEDDPRFAGGAQWPKAPGYDPARETIQVQLRARPLAAAKREDESKTSPSPVPTQPGPRKAPGGDSSGQAPGTGDPPTAPGPSFSWGPLNDAWRVFYGTIHTNLKRAPSAGTIPVRGAQVSFLLIGTWNDNDDDTMVVVEVLGTNKFVPSLADWDQLMNSGRGRVGVGEADFQGQPAFSWVARRSSTMREEGYWVNVDQAPPLALRVMLHAQGKAEQVQEYWPKIQQLLRQVTIGAGANLQIEGADRWFKVGNPGRLEAVYDAAGQPADQVSYRWSGAVTDTGKQIEFTPTSPGSFKIKVEAVKGKTVLAQAEKTIVAVEMALQPRGPTEMFLGVPTTVDAGLTLNGPIDRSRLTLQWQPHPEVRFDPQEGMAATQTEAIFARPGKGLLWNVLLEQRGPTLATVAESGQVAVEVRIPERKIVFEPASPYIGDEVVAKIVCTPNPSAEYMDFRWVPWPEEATLVFESEDTRAVRFQPVTNQPVKLTALSRTPFYGDDLGEVTGSLRARPYRLRIQWQITHGAAFLGRVDPVIHQYVTASVNVTPERPGKTLLYEWAVNEDSHLVSVETGRTVTVTRSQAGPCNLKVTVRDPNGTEFGTGTAVIRFTEPTAPPPLPRRGESSTTVSGGGNQPALYSPAPGGDYLLGVPAGWQTMTDQGLSGGKQCFVSPNRGFALICPAGSTPTRQPFGQHLPELAGELVKGQGDAECETFMAGELTGLAVPSESSDGTPRWNVYLGRGRRYWAFQLVSLGGKTPPSFAAVFASFQPNGGE